MDEEWRLLIRRVKIKRVNRIHREYVCGHVYRLLSEAGVCLILERKMWSVMIICILQIIYKVVKFLRREL